MKTSVKVLGFAAVSVLLASCGSSKVANYLEAFTPEESGLNLVKLTDESTNSIISGNSTKEPALANRAYYKNSSWAYSAEAHFKWCPLRTLAISPDGSKLAYLYKANGQTNIMVRNAGAQGAATQRTFRDVLSFSWAKDNKLYFSDQNGVNYYISSVNADQGSMMQQITNGSVADWNPASLDGQKVFFSRQSANGPSVWSLDRKDGTLTSCASGYNVCLEFIWNNDSKHIRLFFIWAMPVAIIAHEFCQLMGLASGTWDILDLTSYSIAIIIYLLTKKL